MAIRQVTNPSSVSVEGALTETPLHVAQSANGADMKVTLSAEMKIFKHL